MGARWKPRYVRRRSPPRSTRHLLVGQRTQWNHLCACAFLTIAAILLPFKSCWNFVLLFFGYFTNLRPLESIQGDLSCSHGQGTSLWKFANMGMLFIVYAECVSLIKLTEHRPVRTGTAHARMLSNSRAHFDICSFVTRILARMEKLPVQTFLEGTKIMLGEFSCLQK